MENDLADYLIFLGGIYLRCGKIEKAMILFEAFHELSPGDGRHLLGLAYCRFATGDYESALELTGSPGDAATGLLRARTLWALGRHDEAADVMKSIPTMWGGA
jgi:tetratricopeptide (TPR) repeat protein